MVNIIGLIDTRVRADDTSRLINLPTETWLTIDCEAESVSVKQRTQRGREALLTLEEHDAIRSGRLIHVRLDGRSILDGDVVKMDRPVLYGRLDATKIKGVLLSEDGQILLRKVCDSKDGASLRRLVDRIRREGEEHG